MFLITSADSAPPRLPRWETSFTFTSRPADDTIMPSSRWSPLAGGMACPGGIEARRLLASIPGAMSRLYSNWPVVCRSQAATRAPSTVTDRETVCSFVDGHLRHTHRQVQRGAALGCSGGHAQHHRKLLASSAGLSPMPVKPLTNCGSTLRSSTCTTRCQARSFFFSSAGTWTVLACLQPNGANQRPVQK